MFAVDGHSFMDETPWTRTLWVGPARQAAQSTHKQTHGMLKLQRLFCCSVAAVIFVITVVVDVVVDELDDGDNDEDLDDGDDDEFDDDDDDEFDDDDDLVVITEFLWVFLWARTGRQSGIFVILGDYGAWALPSSLVFSSFRSRFRLLSSSS